MVFSHKCGLNTRYVLSTVYVQTNDATVIWKVMAILLTLHASYTKVLF